MQRCDPLARHGDAVEVEAVPAVAPCGGAPERRVAVPAQHHRDPPVPRGLRVDADAGERDVLAANEATSSFQTRRMAATYSAARAPRRANGTPSASNSSRDQPTPTPSVSRPPLKTSRL